MLMYELALNVFMSLDHSFFSNMAACRAGVEDDEESCMSCLNTTKYRCLRCLSKKPCLNFAQDVFKRFSRDPESLLKSLIGI